MATPPENPYSDGARRNGGSRRIWTWIVAGVAALVFSGIVVGSVVSRMDPAETEAAEAPASSEARAQSALVWPENMATGGVIFTDSGSGIDIVRSEAPGMDSAPTPRSAADLGAKALINLYIDYRCPYCALFEQANLATLENVVASGSAALEIHPLTFLDRVDESDYYSSRAAGALACVATEQPEGAWAAHTALMDAGFQPAENVPGHDNAALVSALDDALGGIADEARSCIEEERFVTFATALNQWVFSNPVPGAADPTLTVQGTPFALVDGVPYGGDPEDGESFARFLRQQGVAIP